MKRKILLIIVIFSLISVVYFRKTAAQSEEDSWKIIYPSRVEKFRGMGKIPSSSQKQVNRAPQLNQSPMKPRSSAQNMMRGLTQEERCNIFINHIMRRAEKSRDLQDKMNRRQLELYHSLIDKIVAPCCWTQPVSMHPSDVSEAIKLDLQQRILAGATEEEIIDLYAKNCGERILSIPRFRDIYLIPIFASIFGIGAVLYLILLMSRKKRAKEGQKIETK